jgi:hypothetical protein
MDSQIGLHPSPGDLLSATGFGSLWVENNAENGVDRIDAKRENVVAKVPGPRRM